MLIFMLLTFFALLMIPAVPALPFFAYTRGLQITHSGAGLHLLLLQGALRKPQRGDPRVPHPPRDRPRVAHGAKYSTLPPPLSHKLCLCEASQLSCLFRHSSSLSSPPPFAPTPGV